MDQINHQIKGHGNMEELLARKTWTRGDDEDIMKFTSREKLQKHNMHSLHKSRGQCYMIKFGIDDKTGIDDLRPMWENVINIKELQRELKSPLGVT